MNRLALALVGLGLVYLGLVIPQISRPLMYDDANFALAVEATAHTGVPFGNQGWMSERGDYSQREQWALWHPPLYIYLVALPVTLFGATPAVLRGVGLLAGLVSGLLTYLIARDITRGPTPMRHAAGLIAAGLVLVCPLYVQSTLILDIDFALLLPLMLGFVLAYLRLRDRPGAVALAPLFAVLLWTKMTNPPVLVVVAAVWQALRGAWRRALVHTVVIGGGGALLFGLTWLALARVLGFPLDMPFGVNAVEWQDSSDIARRAYVSVGAFAEALAPTVLWIGPGLVAFGSLAAIVRGADLLRTWRFVKADLLVGLLIVFVLGYINKNAGWFPKYEVVLVPVLACLVAPLAAAAWCAAPRLSSVLAALAAIGSALVTRSLVRDTWALDRTWALSQDAALALVLLVAGCLGVGMVTRRPGPAVCAGLIGLSLGWSGGLDQIQQRAPYATTYWYGTRGVADAAAWVDAHVDPNETYLAPKEVAVRSRARQYVDQENAWAIVGATGRFDGTWGGQPLHTLVTWQRDSAVASLWQTGLDPSHYAEVARYGDYVMYQIRSTNDPG